jgi:7,8-dihydropterin-6-yl-methyl-4-(beta-D-ribofuranosyl)aminobenzene 5'-phosphate synthase
MEQTVRITVLVENTASGRGVRGEHGLAVWIEAGSRRVLFDTGQTADVLFHNARQLGIDLAGVDAVVLSHGHNDHTGGLAEVLRRAPGAHLFLHPAALARRYIRKHDGEIQEIGMPAALDVGFLKENTAGLTWTNQTAAVTEHVFATGPIPRATDFEDTGGDFFLDEPCLEADPIVDDQAVFFDTRDGTVVLLGCGHAGVVNTLNQIQNHTGGRPIHAVLGGMHLINASPERLTRTMDALRGLDVTMLAPAHCTGARAQAHMGTEFPDRWEPSTVGRRFEFPTPERPGPA